MKRRSWVDRQAISGSDLSDVGIFAQEALETLAINMGQGVVTGLSVSASTPANQSVLVNAGIALIYDSSVNRTRIAELNSSVNLSFAGRTNGQYAIVLSVQEVDEDIRTLIPPPPGNPFYDPEATAQESATVKHVVLNVNIQSMPFNPAAAQVILATVNWNGSAVQDSDVTTVLLAPTPNIAPSGIKPIMIDPSLAGLGLMRNDQGTIGLNYDHNTFYLNNGALGLNTNAVGDDKIGNRSFNLNGAPGLPGDPNQPASLTTLLQWIAESIQGITGTGAWNIAPPVTLSTLNTRLSTIEGGALSNLSNLLAQKSDIWHTHNFADIKNKPTTLAGYGITDGRNTTMEGFNPGRPAENEIILAFLSSQVVTVHANDPGQARALTTSTGNLALPITNQNGATLGNVYFAGGNPVGNISLNSDVTLNPGDMLIVTAPGNQDPTFANVALAFKGY